MKTKVFGILKNKVYKIAKITQSVDRNKCAQVVVNFSGSDNHLTLHQIPVVKRNGDLITFKYNNGKINNTSITLSTKQIGKIPITYNWISSSIQGSINTTMYKIAELNWPKKSKEELYEHTKQSQSILQKVSTFDGKYNGYLLGSSAVNISNENISTVKTSCCPTVRINSTEFMLDVILSRKDNKYKDKSSNQTYVKTVLGDIFLVPKPNRKFTFSYKLPDATGAPKI